MSDGTPPNASLQTLAKSGQRCAGGGTLPPKQGAVQPASLPKKPEQRFEWIEAQTVGNGDESIKAVRAGSLGTAAPGGRSATPDPSWPPTQQQQQPSQPPPQSPAQQQLWTDDKVASIVDSNVRSPNVKIQLLTRALEESRLRMQMLLRDRTATADAVLRLCTLAGMSAEAATTWESATTDGEDGPARRLDLLRSQVEGLQAELAARGVALAEAQAGHEEVAMGLVAQGAELEEAQEALAAARHAEQGHVAAQAALAHKLQLLETQLAAESSSARRRMEEQLDTFRGDAESARSLRGRLADAAHEVELAQRGQRDEAERASQLALQVDRLRTQLKEANSRAAGLSQQLLGKSAACAEAEEAAHRMAEENRELAAASRSLQMALADHKERALRADSLAASLAAAQDAAAVEQGALQAEIGRLREDLRGERERSAAMQAQLADERLACQSLRAWLQAKEEEIGSLLLRLDEYTSRVVLTEEALAAAQRAAEQVTQRCQTTETLAERQRHEVATLQASLSELATAEVAARQAQTEAASALAAAQEQAARHASERSQLLEEANALRQEVSALQATVAEQARQLAAMARLEEQCGQQEAQLASLADRLRHESDACARWQQSSVELTTAKQQLEDELHKAGVVSTHHRQKAAELGKQLEAAAEQLKGLQAEVEQSREAAASAQEAHEKELATLESMHAARKHKNEQLEHNNRQQATLIARLEKSNASLAARLAAEQGRAETLRRFALAHSQAYGRLAGHAAGLQETFRRQLASLLALCRHSGLQLEGALVAADPMAALQGPEHATHPPAVRAALEGLDRLHVELRIAVAMLEAQTNGISSSESRALAEVPQGIEAALQAELAGLPAEVLQAPGRAAARPVACLPASSSSSSAAAAPATDAAASPPVEGGPPLAGMSAQLAAMEQGLEALVHQSLEQRARAEVAEAVLQQEQEARRRAQDLAATLAADLACSQARLAAVQGERSALEQRCADLSGQLRDAIYTLMQNQAAAQGKALSWALRGLRSAGTQTSYCELWLRTISGAGVPIEQQQQQQLEVVEPAADIPLGELVDAACGDSSGSSGAEADSAGSPPPARPPPLAELQRLLADIWRAKAVNDIAVARGQRPFLPLPDFLPVYFAQQHGPCSAAAAARREQLRAWVEAWAGSVGEVALFGLSAGLLVEGAEGQLLSTRGRATSASSSPGTPGAAVPLVLYQQRRQAKQAATEEALASLRRFCHSAWHAAYLASCARQPAVPFGPGGALHAICGEVQALVASLPGAEVLLRWVGSGSAGACLAQLDLGMRLGESQVPQLYLLAVEAARLLGMRSLPRLYVQHSAEAAVHYLLLPAAAGACPAFHGLAGGLATTQEAVRSSSSGRDSRRQVAGRGIAAEAAAAASAEEPELSSSGSQWECALVLTSQLVDLLEPEELLAVLGGAMAFHAALEAQPSPVGAAESDPSTPAGSAGTKEANGGGGDDKAAMQARLLARSLAATQTLAALAALAPEQLLRALPHQAGPLFHGRLRPCLLRAAKYLAFARDRAALLAVGGRLHVVAAAAVKLAAGSAVLRHELAVDAVLAQARALEDAAVTALPALLRQEETAGAAAPSLTVLRVNELLKYHRQRSTGQRW